MSRKESGCELVNKVLLKQLFEERKLYKNLAEWSSGKDIDDLQREYENHKENFPEMYK